MNIAFYAPMKAPTHPSPSGDRRMARLLIEALAAGDHRVEIASTFRSWEGQGDVARQVRLARLGQRLAERLVRRFERCPRILRPDLWFTYHLYHKAPDHVGPRVSKRMGIPYVVAEASHAPKRARGAWAAGHRAAAEAIRKADAVISLNPADAGCVRPLLRHGARYLALRPFVGTMPAAHSHARSRERADVARRLGFMPEAPWLLTVAMMRRGDKLASYRLLARALGMLGDRPWHLMIAGDGAARRDVEAAFARLGAGRIGFLGLLNAEQLAPLYRCADLFVWPAVNEAYGMAVLEAQSMGMPVVAGRGDGVAAVVRDGRTGVLVAPGDASALAAAVRELLECRTRLASMGANARRVMAAEHGLESVVTAMRGLLDGVRADYRES